MNIRKTDITLEQPPRRRTVGEQVSRAAAIGLAGACVVLSAVIYRLAPDDDASAHDAFNALGEKANPCSSEKPSGVGRDLAACSQMLKAPTLSLVYAEGTNLDPGYYAERLEDTYSLMTAGKGKLTVREFKVTGELAAEMLQAECAPEDAVGSFATRAAVERPDINENDFVMALNQQHSCGPLQVGGITYGNLGHRFMDVFNVPDGDSKNNDAKEWAAQAAGHEEGHGITALGHSSSRGFHINSSMSLLAHRSDSGIIEVDLSKLESVLEYGDKESIMGRHVDPNGNPIFTHPLTPIELDRISLELDGSAPRALTIGGDMHPQETTLRFSLDTIDEYALVLPEKPVDSRTGNGNQLTYHNVGIVPYSGMGVSNPSVGVYTFNRSDDNQLKLGLLDLKPGEVWRVTYAAGQKPIEVHLADDGGIVVRASA